MCRFTDRTNLLAHCGGLAVVVMAGMLAPGIVEAQHTLRGQVVDTTGAGLPGVEVVLAEAGRRAATDSSGRYTVSNIPAGRYEVVFRRLGYAPTVLFRSFLGDTGTTKLDVQLRQDAVVLPEVETRAKGPEAVPLKLQAWARRREFNVGGKFWDDSLLRTQEHRQLSSVLQSVSGVQLVRWRGKTLLATGGGRAGTTLPPRRPGSRPGERNDNEPPLGCYVMIFLDGVRLAFAGPEPPNLDDIPVNHLAAIEFYRSASEIPAEFNVSGSVCGVLAVWTR